MAILDFQRVKLEGISVSRLPNLVSIFLSVSDLQGVKISVFPLTLLVIVTTVLPLQSSL